MMTFENLLTILESALAGIGSAMLWSRYQYTKFHTRLEKAEARMQAHVLDNAKDYATHATQIAVMQTCQEDTKRRLEGIEETTGDTNKKLDQLIRDVLQAIQR